MRVKLISEMSVEDLQNSVNRFLYEFENSYEYEVDYEVVRSIKDIKYSSFVCASGLCCYSAMVIFET